MPSGGTDSYRFTAPAGTAVIVQASSLSRDDLPLILLRVSGPGVEDSTCSGVLSFVSRGGTVTVDVSPCQTGGGSYTLTPQVVSGGGANCAMPLQCGLTPLGTELSVPGEVDAFRFAAAGGSQVRIGIQDEEGVSQAYSLRVFDRDGRLVDSRCANVTNLAIPSTGEYTALISSCVGLRTAGYRIERFDSSCPRGPQITYMGLLPQNQQILVSKTFDEAGRPIYFGQRGTLVVEARPGESGAVPGGNAYSPFLPPDLQLILDRAVGDGSAAVCDTDPPGGVPATRPFVFSDDATTVDHMNDLGCRVDDGRGDPKGHRVELDACPRSVSGSPSFVADDTTIEFCLPVSLALAFGEGDTIVKARLRDQNQELGAEREIVVRVATARPTMTPTPTRTFTSSPTRTPTRVPTTPTVRPPGPCTCDCNENGRVSVAELTRAVRIALAQLTIPACRLADGDDSGAVEIGDLVAGARNALEGCPPAPRD